MFFLFCFISIFEIYKDSQFNYTKIKNSKIQLQNKTQTFSKSYAFLNKVYTRRGHININNNNNNIDNNNKIYIERDRDREIKRKRETERQKETETKREA